MSIRENKQAWEDWGAVDPLWAVLTEPAGRNGQWDVESFFASGQQLIDEVFRAGQGLGLPSESRSALDFGCGVGRLTRGLTKYVDHVVGVDIAESMLREARRLNASFPTCEFVRNDAANLQTLADNSYDVVVTFLALQHIPSTEMIGGYVGELVRVLAPGGLLAFQLPTYVPPPPEQGLRSVLRPRTRLAAALRRVGVSAQWMYSRWGWKPAMPMTAIPHDRVVELIEAAGGRVVHEYEMGTDHGGVKSHAYYATC